MKRETVYPEWVQQYRTTGKTVKKVGDHFYLYQHTSKRVPGKKNPVPVDTYIGVITPDGIVEGKKKKVSTDSSVIVKEYGFSYAMMKCCPDSWKKVAGDDYEAKLKKVIRSRSKNSYLENTAEMDKVQDQTGSIASSLQRHLKEKYSLTLDELQILDTIYIVEISGKKFISDISDEQQKLLDKLQIGIEANSDQ